jgi:hypothetical protein
LLSLKMTHRLGEFLHQRLLQEKFAVQMVANGRTVRGVG